MTASKLIKTYISLTVGLLSWLLTTATGAAAATAGGPLPHYTITDLGTLGGAYSIAMGINDRGQVVGGSSLPAHSLSLVLHTHAFLWDAGRMRDAGMLPGFPYAVAHGINSTGQVVGGSEIPASSTGILDFKMVSHAFLWQDGHCIDLSAGSSAFSNAYSINDLGQVVGESNARAVLWQDGQVRPLGTLGGKVSSAKAINNNGQVVGDSMLPGGIGPHAFLYSGGVTRDLGTLGGRGSQAYSINTTGQVVGWANTVTGDRHSFLWQDGQLRDLGTLRGRRSAAFGINDAGQIVGSAGVRSSEGHDEIDHAYLWQNDVLLDLNGLLPVASGWTLEEATAINNKGQITGTGAIAGAEHAFLLTPVVE